ncbi:hypothetical protein [Shewanella algae]|uniref:hypothetical protein n=1 Tax=Shewanella algae TaxID=38313 RepID=UPI0031F4BA78
MTPVQINDAINCRNQKALDMAVVFRHNHKSLFGITYRLTCRSFTQVDNDNWIATKLRNALYKRMGSWHLNELRYTNYFPNLKDVDAKTLMTIQAKEEHFKAILTCQICQGDRMSAYIFTT